MMMELEFHPMVIARAHIGTGRELLVPSSSIIPSDGRPMFTLCRNRARIILDRPVSNDRDEESHNCRHNVARRDWLQPIKNLEETKNE